MDTVFQWLGFALPFRLVLPQPDASPLDQGDIQQLLYGLRLPIWAEAQVIVSRALTADVLPGHNVVGRVL